MSAFDTQVGSTHYKDLKAQPIEFILDNELGFCEGCVVKYVCRWKAKGGVEDLKKAKHYLEMLIETVEKAPAKTYEDKLNDELDAKSHSSFSAHQKGKPYMNQQELDNLAKNWARLQTEYVRYYSPREPQNG